MKKQPSLLRLFKSVRKVNERKALNIILMSVDGTPVIIQFLPTFIIEIMNKCLMK